MSGRLELKASRGATSSLVDAFDDPQVALSPIPQNGECRLVLRAIVYSDCFGEALKLNHNSPLFDAMLIRFSGGTASEEAPARSEDSRNSELGVFLACCVV
jgi:hypothetical protein